MRRRRLRHRATYIVVVDGAGRLVVHQRALWKDVNPGFFDVAFGGVCGVGEDWMTSATRELAEEAGLALADLSPPSLVDLGPFEFGDDVVGRFFVAGVPGTAQDLNPADGEVIAVDAVALDDLDDWYQSRSVCADSWDGWLRYADDVAAWAATRAATAAGNDETSAPE